MEAWAEIEAAALERNDRFLAEIVEGLNICPYARSARLGGATARFVLPDRLVASGELDASERLAEILRDFSDSDSLEVVQLIFPRVACDGRTWVRAAKQATATLQARLGRSAVGVAAFHPALEYRTESPAALVPLLRRSPDPMIQWIRLDALERVRAGRPDGDTALPTNDADQMALLRLGSRRSLDEEIAAANFRRVHDFGIDEFADTMRRIARPVHNDDASST